MKMQSRGMLAAGLALMLGAAVPSALHAADTAKQDKMFVTDSGKGSLAEIEMAKLALRNSTNADVRKFAQKMVHDHTMLIEQMKPFAQKMGVPPPTRLEHPERAEYDRLSGKKGESFDKDYITTMVDDHHKDLADFTTEMNTTDNPQLKAAVTKGREVIAMHNEMIDSMAQKYGIAVPPSK